MEAQAAFIRADRAVALHAEAAVDVHFSAVVHPGDAENHNALRLHNAFQDFEVHQLRIFGNIGGDAFHHLTYGLVEFVFTGVAGNDFAHETLDVIAGKIVHIFSWLYTLLIRKFT